MGGLTITQIITLIILIITPTIHPIVTITHLLSSCRRARKPTSNGKSLNPLPLFPQNGRRTGSTAPDRNLIIPMLRNAQKAG